MVKPVLVFGYGNLSRGDDALGPLLLDYIERQDWHGVEILSDFQLQIEHALDLENRALVLFVDASVSCRHAFDFAELKPARDKSYTTHAMSPTAVLAVYQEIKKQAPPPCFLLSIKGERFELGEGLTVQAEQHLALASQFVGPLLSQPDLTRWLQQANR
ncbi:MAG: hydrogenase maturation protease [Methylovulum sp.]|nr:hydrogenase maturation protease [Methylovulum sp.]